MTYHTKLIAGGKLVVPAELRRDLGIAPGDRLVIERDGEGFVVKAFSQVVRETQAKFRAMMGDYSVDQFLAERRADWGED